MTHRWNPTRVKALNRCSIYGSSGVLEPRRTIHPEKVFVGLWPDYSDTELSG